MFLIRWQDVPKEDKPCPSDDDDVHTGAECDEMGCERGHVAPFAEPAWSDERKVS